MRKLYGCRARFRTNIRRRWWTSCIPRRSCSVRSRRWWSSPFFFGLAWRQERKSLELLLWSSAFSIGAVGFVLLTLRSDGYNFVTISLGNALAVLALAMIWLGLRAFDNQPLKIASALFGPILWIAVTYFSDFFRESVTSRIVLYSALIFAYSALIALEIFRSDNFRRLPSSHIVAFVFATHGVLYLARIPLIVLWPLAGNTASPSSPW
ncbi:hypothetical protein [Sinorhizobium sp. Sb3]|uniref:hypothetical protein n=1 Tax=Sinorhizobium sp. Sb3 TaxID=1358417 RepID=UPI00071E3E72|nr:hypothetical protein [Sinorhizobium sp. Sb3]